MDAYYEYAQHPAMLKIERQVCGCDYGASSWTTRAEADRMAVLLELRSGSRLLDIGSGSGWPGLYLSRISGCDLTLVDLPIFGLKIAQTRWMKETSNSSVWLALADAAALPFADASFDAVCHADLLCCLLCKEAVLRACQNILRPGRPMVFSVISIPPRLSESDHRRALEAGPEFVASKSTYRSLLAQTGWTVEEQQDVTESIYRQLCKRLCHVLLFLYCPSCLRKQRSISAL
jgi:ubiquinone/menaquinone biosynthesis C-methylase UbiE